MSTDAQIEAEIQAKGLTAPRVTPEQIEKVIREEFYFTAAQGARMEVIDASIETGNPYPEKYMGPSASSPMPELALLTFCVLVLKNGFTVTGESACASPENFNAELGRKIARQNAVAKIWPLEGYRLKQDLYEEAERTQPKE